MANIPVRFWDVCARLDKALIKEQQMLICNEETIQYYLVPLSQAKKVDKATIEKMARERGAIASYETVVHS